MPIQVGGSVLPVPASVSAGAPVDCRALEAKSVNIIGAFTGSIQVQLSLDPSNPPASTSWTNVGVPFTAPGVLFVPQPCAWIRVNVTALSAGTPTGTVAGMTSIL
jgi:hypothetical protein